MYTIKAKQHFDSAHFLFGYEGKCRNIHGHRWEVETEVYAERLQSDGQCRGMVIDFGDLKGDLKEIADYFDHCLIMERGTLKESTLNALLSENFRIVEVDFRPTAENFSKFIFDKMSETGYRVRCTTVYETPDNCAAYFG